MSGLRALDEPAHVRLEVRRNLEPASASPPPRSKYASTRAQRGKARWSADIPSASAASRGRDESTVCAPTPSASPPPVFLVACNHIAGTNSSSPGLCATASPGLALLAGAGRSRLGGSRGLPVLVPARASPVPSVVREFCCKKLEFFFLRDTFPSATALSPCMDLVCSQGSAACPKSHA